MAKLMMMRMVKEMDLRGLAEMRQAALAAFAAKSRTFNRGGVSPLQAITGKNNMIPASLMEQLASGRVRFRYNEEITHNDALARSERIRAGAIAAFHWLDAHTALRKALASRSRPPALEAIREGTVVYVYEPPPSRRGLARRLQDHSSWSGPGVVVCVERDHSVPRRLWVQIRGRIKTFPLEKVRLATPDEMTSSQFITDALKDVEAELRKGNVIVDEPAADDAAEEASNKRKAEVEDEMSSRGASSTDTSEEDPDEATRARRARLLDVPLSVKRNLAERRKREEGGSHGSPHAGFCQEAEAVRGAVKDVWGPD